MKSSIILTLAALSFLLSASLPAATVTGRSELSTLAGTEKIPIDDGGVDKYILTSTLRAASVFTGGFTASGSSALDLSGSTGAFLTSTGANTFGGSSNLFSAALEPASNDLAALGSVSKSWSDLFLASGGVINFANGEAIMTHSSGVITIAGSGGGDLRITTAGTNAASAVTVGGTQTLTAKTINLTSNTLTATSLQLKTALSDETGSGAAVFATSPTLVTPVLGAATATSINGATISSTSGGTLTLANSSSLITSGANSITLTSTATTDVTLPTTGTLATLAGTETLTNKTVSLTSNTLTATSLQLKTAVSDETGSGVLVFATSPTLTTPTIGVATATSVNKVAITAPATSATLTISDGKTLAATESITLTGTDSTIMTFPSTSATIARTDAAQTFTGTQTFGAVALTGAATTSGTVIQTSASANAFATGLAGNTNPVFRTVNNIASQATGISITGRAEAAGADITVLSSGTNEQMNLEAKGSGAILMNGTATGAVLVGDATNPAFSVVHTTEGTGVKVTSAAAASGVAVAAISSGTNENLTINAKGSGTVSLNSTATGAVIATKARMRPETTVYTNDGAITLTTGVHFIEKTSAAAMTVAAPSSQDGERLTIIGNTDFAHVITFTGTTLLDGTTGANVTATLAAFKGASVTVVARGTSWLVESSNQATIAP
jgi:hypothetical protein